MIEVAKSARIAIEHLDHLKPLDGIGERIEALFSRLERKLDDIAPRHGEVVDLPNPLRRVN